MVYIAEATELSANPGAEAIAFRVVVLLIDIGLVYCLEDNVGVLPSVV
jgi:hypothetical protein